MAFRQPWKDGAKAYHEADTLADALEGFKRVRSVKSFILTGTVDDPECASCGKPLSEDDAPRGYTGNRCEYDPRTKSITARHYTCGWGVTLGEVAKLRLSF